MKKIIIIFAILLYTTSFGNTKEKKVLLNFNNFIENLSEVDNKIYSSETNLLLNEVLIEKSFQNSYKRVVNTQILGCALVQMNVYLTYYDNPNFTLEQVNEMALGAFMGCMGWIR